MHVPGVILYNPNNSGGSWWLNPADYERLEAAGWVVHWAREMEESFGFNITIREYEKDQWLVPITRTPGLHWLGAEAGSAAKRFNTVEEGINEFASITGQNLADYGCSCCGPPHAFEWWEDGSDHTKYISPEAVAVWDY